MPELPDVTVYVEALRSRIAGQVVRDVKIASPFVLRSVDPPIASVVGQAVTGVDRLGKRIVIGLDGDLWIVIHLMIAGRFRWLAPGKKPPGKLGLAGLGFDGGRAVADRGRDQAQGVAAPGARPRGTGEFARGGLEPLEASEADFVARLRSENHTLKRALTDPRLFSGIGNSYSDEILHRARLSPLLWTSRLDDEGASRLYAAVRETLVEWTERLRRETGEKLSREGDGVPRGDGGARPVREAVPGVRRAGAADPVRRQRDQLLRAVPDRGKVAGGPGDVAVAQGRLAEEPG